MTQNPAEFTTPAPVEALKLFTDAAAEMAAAQIMFCEQLFGVAASDWGPHPRHPSFNERPSVSARDENWVND